MGKVAWVVAIAVVAALAWLLLFANEFANGYAELRELYRQNGVAEGTLAPPTLLQIAPLEAGLAEFEAELKARQWSADNAALIALVDARGNALEALKNILEAQRDISGIGLYNPDCGVQGKAASAREKLGSALESADAAKGSNALFSQSSAAKAGVAEADLAENFSDAMDSMKAHAEELLEYVNSQCP